MEITFTNVTITIVAASPKAAYAELCSALIALGPDIEWETDEYFTEQDTEPQSTRGLWAGE